MFWSDPNLSILSKRSDPDLGNLQPGPQPCFTSWSPGNKLQSSLRIGSNEPFKDKKKSVLHGPWRSADLGAKDCLYILNIWIAWVGDVPFTYQISTIIECVWEKDPLQEILMQILFIKIRVRVADPTHYKNVVLNPDPKSDNVRRVFTIYVSYKCFLRLNM